jgi:death-on-curing protein
MNEWLDIDFAEKIHALQIEKHGGAPGLRDKTLLDSALAQPFMTFAGVDLHPSTEEKAAKLAFGIIRNHPFADGNKRTATQLMMIFMRM